MENTRTQVLAMKTPQMIELNTRVLYDPSLTYDLQIFHPQPAIYLFIESWSKD